MKYYIYIKADQNDADYIAEMTEIHPDDDIEDIKLRLKLIADAIKNYSKLNPHSHNWPYSEYLQESPECIYADVLSANDIEWFRWYLPHGEHGIHTIESIKFLEVADELDLL